MEFPQTEFDFAFYDFHLNTDRYGESTDQELNFKPAFAWDWASMATSTMSDCNTTRLDKFQESSHPTRFESSLDFGSLQTPSFFEESGHFSLDWPFPTFDSDESSQVSSCYSNPSGYHTITNQSVGHVSPLSIDRDSSSSSESSLSYNESLMTPRKYQKRLPKYVSTRPRLPTMSQRNRDVLKNALFYHSPNPTRDQSSFLAKALRVSEHAIGTWQKALSSDESNIPKCLKLAKPHKTGRIADWKLAIIRRGFQKAKTPSNQQIGFLAAGLRISVEQLWQSIRETDDKNISDVSENRKRTNPSLPQATRPLQELPSLSDDINKPAIKNMKTAIRLSDSPCSLLPLKSSTISIDSSISSPLIKQEIEPDDPISIIDAISSASQYPCDSLPDIKPITDCNESAAGSSVLVRRRIQSVATDTDMNDDGAPNVNLHEETSARVPTTLHIDDSDMDSVDDGYLLDPILEREVATLLGPNYVRLAGPIISRFAAASVYDKWEFEYGTRQHAGESGSTQSSNSSHTPGSFSSSSASTSGLSGGKRKSLNDGGQGSDDLDPNDGDRSVNPQPMKKPKTPQIRYDCPFFRKSISSGSTVRSCALKGLEFRNLWDHFRKAHYGCETCHLKLDSKRADKTHLRERQKDATICDSNKSKGAKFDIGIDMFAALEEIYDDRSISADDKWKRWWTLLFPDAGEAPDPRHYDTISISTADIAAFQVSFCDMWRENKTLPRLDDVQQKAAAAIVEKLLRTAPVIQQYRRQSTLPRTPRTPANAANLQAVAFTAGPSPAYTGIPEQMRGWDPSMLTTGDSPFNLTGSYDNIDSNSFSQNFGGMVDMGLGQNA